MSAEEMINMAINAKRDTQTLTPVLCKKCNIAPHITENMMRTRYWVECYGCLSKTYGSRKIDDAIKQWNKKQGG